MKVKCIHNSTKPFFVKKFPYESYENYEKALIIGKEYLVYGIDLYENDFKYLIFNEYGEPFWYLNKLFIILDNITSSYWFYKNFDSEEHSLKMIIGYDEIVNLENHYDNLWEGKQEDQEIFYKRKKEMDLEFPDNSIEEKATLIDQNWLMCPKCIDAWETTSVSGMVECPKCKTVMHNPRYKRS